MPVKAGELIRLVTPGGGGWGDPLERPVDAVRLDVLRKLVSSESAERDYGVVLNGGDLVIDHKKTKTLRKKIAAERGPDQTH